MNKVRSRTWILLLLLAALIAGITFYVVKYVRHGAEWASFSANNGYYSGGVLAVGTVKDRNGVVLSEYEDGKRLYADDKTTRISTLHAVGDRYGYIGTGALKVFAPKLVGYDLINGSYSLRSGGNDLYLTIDAELNNTAYKALDGRKGVVAVCNYKTGEILCMVSAPSYDPSNPPDSFDDGKYEGVFINRFLSSTYTPGSTFKLVTSVAAIENLPDWKSLHFDCDGSEEIGGSAINCTNAHGELDMEGALAYSCNVAYGQIAVRLGAETLMETAERLGLTERQSVDGVSTSKGSFVLPENDNQLAWAGIGQFKDQISPAAMLRFVSAIANGGKAEELRLVHKVRSSVGLPAGFTGIGKEAVLFSSETADILADMMANNVKEVYGSKKFPGLDLCAKSGTAEVGGGKEPHALFTGFLRDEKTPYAFIVIVENGGRGSSVAGNVANQVLQKAVAE